MIQLHGFTTLKESARLAFGRQSGTHFHNNADLQKRWETTLDSRVALDLVGGASSSPENLEDVRAWLGPLRADEEQFAARFRDVYATAAALTTTVPAARPVDVDLFETLLDARIIARHTPAPRRVLDIGPGAGRHLVHTALGPWGQQAAYVGVDSVGLPYMLQNIVGAALTLREPSWRVFDQVDYALARADFPTELEPRQAWHTPLWATDLLPSASFDVVICNYVLDELSGPDFRRVVDLIDRCLAPGGIVYCRGGQERAMFKALYLFGFGNFHQIDITRTLRERGLTAQSCEVIASTIVRVLSRGGGATTGYAALTSDVELVEAVQRDYIAAAVNTLKASQARVVIWADPGYQALDELLARHLPELNVVGVTNEHIVHAGRGPHGLIQLPLSAVAAQRPEAALIAGYRTSLAVRELREALAPATVGPIRRFNWPFAHAPIHAS